MKLGAFGSSLCRVSKNGTFVNTYGTTVSRLCDREYNPITGVQYKERPYLIDCNFFRRHIWNPMMGAQYKGCYDVEKICMEYKKDKFNRRNILKRNMDKARSIKAGDY